MAYLSQYPPAFNDTYVKATHYYGEPSSYTYKPYNTTNPVSSLVGYIWWNQWYSLYSTNQRFHIDLGTAKTVVRIYYENLHNYGSGTDAGAKNFTFWGSNSASDFADLVYANDGTWVQLTTSQSTLDQHISSNIVDPKYIDVTNTAPYRYYAFKFADNYGSADSMGVRRIELQINSGEAKTIDSNAKIFAEDVQKTINSNATIFAYSSLQKNIISSTKIKATDVPQTIDSDAKIKIPYIQKTIDSNAKILWGAYIYSNARIIELAGLKTIISNAKIVLSTLINTSVATNFVTKLTKNSTISTILDTVLNRTLDIFYTALFTRFKINNTINTNLATKLVSYDTIQPKNLHDIIVKKDGSELLDVDYSTLKIQFNLNSTPSNATFTLARHHDDIDRTLGGVSSIISAENKIQIYDSTILLFTGYITQIKAVSSTDTVEITAQDVRCKISKLSMEVSYGAKYEDDTTEIINELTGGDKDIIPKPQILTSISTATAINSVLTAIGSLISGHDTVDFGFIPEYTTTTSDYCSLLDTLINNSANANWYIDENEFLRIQKIENGTIKSLPLSSTNVHRHIYDTILNDITLNRIQNNYYKSLLVTLGEIENRHWTRRIFGFDWGQGGYFGSPAPDDAQDLTAFSFQSYFGELHYTGVGREEIYGYYPGIYSYWEFQWLLDENKGNIHKQFNPPIPRTIVVGSGLPQKSIFLTSYGIKNSNSHWEDRPGSNGGNYLCTVKEETYDFTSFAVDTASFELSQNNKLLTEATISLLLDAYEYYNLSFKDLINISNTISANCYVNNNGFPLNISGISIDCSTRIVTINLTNYGKSYYQRIGNIFSNFQPIQYSIGMKAVSQIKYSQFP
jgi:hypothetical protein